MFDAGINAAIRAEVGLEVSDVTIRLDNVPQEDDGEWSTIVTWRNNLLKLAMKLSDRLIIMRKTEKNKSNFVRCVLLADNQRFPEMLAGHKTSLANFHGVEDKAVLLCYEGDRYVTVAWSPNMHDVFRQIRVVIDDSGTIECMICCTVVNHRVILDCTHTFCETCIGRMSVRLKEVRQCRACNRVHTVTAAHCRACGCTELTHVSEAAHNRHFFISGQCPVCRSPFVARAYAY